jgi:hypothetical protein
MLSGMVEDDPVVGIRKKSRPDTAGVTQHTLGKRDVGTGESNAGVARM